MNSILNGSRFQIRQTESEPVSNGNGSAGEFRYMLENGKVHFTPEERAAYLQFRLKSRHYVLESRFFVLLTAPVIWICVVPIMLTDIIGSLYQAICFPIYGIPKVRRRDYVAFDRHHLTYLDFFEKLNCEYCAYVNGILAYFTEIAARTEQHWCPVKHAGCVKCAHSRYGKFVDFGDARRYCQQVEEVRRSYEDVEASDAARTVANPDSACGA
jgi:hypothetical protein